MCLNISLFTKADIKPSLLILGRAHCFFGDFKKRLYIFEGIYGASG